MKILNNLNFLRRGLTMKLDMKQTESFDHIEEIEPVDSNDVAAKFYFRGTRDWMWDFAKKGVGGEFKLSFTEQYELLVQIMVKWEGVYDLQRNLPIPFNKEKALQILRTFEIISQERMSFILMTVWSKISSREDALKNLVAGETNLVEPAEDGSKSVSDTATIQSPTVKSVRKKRVKK